MTTTARQPSNVDHAKTSSIIPYISLFSGAGGLDFGIEAARTPLGARFQSVLAVENDQRAADTLKAATVSGHFSKKFSVLPDVRDLNLDELELQLNHAGTATKDIELIVGGPPCPTFSTVGNRGSVSDDRGQLVFDFLNVVDAVRPRFFLMENVKGLVSAAVKHRPLNQRGAESAPLSKNEQLGSALKVILDRMREIGYDVVHGVVNSANYGSPQLRHRALFFGSRDHEFPTLTTIEDLMPRTHFENPGEGQLHWNSLGDALNTVPLAGQPEYQAYSAERRSWFEMIPEGKNWRHLRDHVSVESAAIAMGGAWNSTGGRVGFYRRLSWDRPSPTLLTSPIQKATGFCHPEEHRPLSVQEYSRIQEFPDDYPFHGSLSQRYRQIGNAVPVSLAQAAGEALLKLIGSGHGA
jgi:DNA (cytosine-5)-methyltransferase 1